MACLSLSGLTKSCGSAIGGIKSIFIIEYDGVESFTMTNPGEVDAITWTSGYTGADYDFLDDNSNWTEPIVGDGIVASSHWQPAVTLVFRKLSLAARNEITELSKGEVIVFLEDSNGTSWMIGSDRGLNLAASAGSQTGSTMEELNGNTVLLSGKETYMAYVVDTTAITYPV